MEIKELHSDCFIMIVKVRNKMKVNVNIHQYGKVDDLNDEKLILFF